VLLKVASTFLGSLEGAEPGRARTKARGYLQRKGKAGKVLRMGTGSRQSSFRRREKSDLYGK
jgi:hypothetical protein